VNRLLSTQELSRLARPLISARCSQAVEGRGSITKSRSRIEHPDDRDSAGRTAPSKRSDWLMARLPAGTKGSFANDGPSREKDGLHIASGEEC
jgi:hypothetical protein